MKLIQSIWTRLQSRQGWVLMDQVVFSGTSFLTTLILARGLDINVFGSYAAILLVAYLVLSINASLVSTPFQVLMARVEDKKSYQSVLLVMQLLFLVLFGLTGLLVGQLFPGIWSGTNLLIIVLFIGAFLLHDFFRRLFLADGKPNHAFHIDLISGFTQILLLDGVTFTEQLDLEKALIIITVTYLPAFVLALLLLKPIWIKIADLRKHIAIHLTQGKWFLATAVLQWSSQNFLVAAAGLYLGAGVLAAFRLGQTLFGVLNAVLQVFENYAVPVASGLYHRSGEAFTHYLRQLNRKSMIGAVLILALIAVFAEPIYKLSGGASYAGYAYILQGMALLYFFIFLSNPVRIAIRVMMLNKAFFMAYLFSFLFSLVLSRLLIREWEVNGIILGLILNQVIMLVYWQILLIRKRVILWK